MFHFSGCPRTRSPWIVTSLNTRSGFPIRTSPDQRLLATSPRLIAGCYVLHRLFLSRHPPYALELLSLPLKHEDVLWRALRHAATCVVYLNFFLLQSIADVVQLSKFAGVHVGSRKRKTVRQCRERVMHAVRLQTVVSRFHTRRSGESENRSGAVIISIRCSEERRLK